MVQPYTNASSRRGSRASSSSGLPLARPREDDEDNYRENNSERCSSQHTASLGAISPSPSRGPRLDPDSFTRVDGLGLSGLPGEYERPVAEKLMRDKLRRMQGGQGPDPERRGRSPTRKFLAYDRSRESGGQMPPFPPANLAARPTSSAARGFQTEAARGLSNEAKAFPPLPGRGPGTGSQVPTSNLQYSALVPGMVPGSTMSMRGKQRGKASPATSSQQRSSQEAARRNPLDKHNYPPLPGTGATQSPATISYAGLAKNGLGETVNMRGVGTVEKNVPLPSRRRPGAPPLEVGKGPLATPSSQSGSRVPSRHRPELSLSNKVTFPNLPGHGNRSSSQTGQPLPYGKLFKQAAAPEKRANVPVFRSAANPPPGGSKGAAAGTHAVDARSRSASRGRQPGPPGQPPKTPEHSRPRGRSLADSGLTRSTGTPAQQATRPLSNSPLLENWWEWEPK